MSYKEEQYESIMSRGHSAAWDKDWIRAGMFYRQVLEENPEDIKALSSLALALFESKDYEESLKYYLRVARITPEDPIPLEKAALLYKNVGKPKHATEMALKAAELYLKNREIEKAIQNWSWVIGVNPENLRAHSRLAVLYERMKHRSQAVREYLHIASLMQHMGKLERATQAVNHALMISPESNAARQALRMLRENVLLPKPARPRGGTGPISLTEEPEVDQIEAPKEEEDESDLDPVTEAQNKALSVLASEFFERPTDEEVKESSPQRGFQAIMSGIDPRAPKQADHTSIMLHLSQAVDQQMKGDLPQAAEEFSRAMDAGLENVALYFNLGYLYVENGRLESAVRLLRRSVNHPDFALASRLLIGQTLQKLGRQKGAAIVYLEALKIADAMVIPLEHATGLHQLYEPLIEAQTQESDEDHHVQLSENIEELLMRPNWKKHLKSIREQLLTQPDGGQSIPVAEILIQSKSSQVVETLANVQDLARKGYMRAAMEEAFYALHYAPTYLPLHMHMGELLIKSDRIPEAIDKFLMVANFYSVRGESGRAIDVLRRVVQLAPMDLESRRRLIEQLIARGDIEEAIAEQLKLGEVYYNMAEIASARQTYSDSLRLAQQHKVEVIWKIRAMHRIADLDIQSLDWHRALRMFEKIRNLDPGDQKARQNLVDLNFRLGQSAQALNEIKTYITYMENTGEIEPLGEFLETLLRDYPKNAFIHQQLGDHYRKAGQISDAIVAYDTAGELYMEAGDRGRARFVITSILELNPPNADHYRQLLPTL